METSSNLPGMNSNPSISSAEAIPASRSVKPESAAENPTLGIFGRSSPDYFAYLDPDTCCWKTSQATLALASDLFSETWPDSGTMRNGRVYALRTSGRVTSGSGCSLWPTAKTQEPHRRLTGGKNLSLTTGEEYQVGLEQMAEQVWNRWPSPHSEDSESAGNHPGAVDSLTGATRNWPTANAHDATGARGKGFELTDRHYSPHDLVAATDTWRTPDAPGTGGPRNRQGSRDAGHQITIAEQAELWQTQATDSFRSRGGDRKDEMGLDQQARMFPTKEKWTTPTAGNACGDNKAREGGSSLTDDATTFHPSPPAPQIPDGPPSCESGQTSRRRLNPRFVEWLLGFPISWTEVRE